MYVIGVAPIGKHTLKDALYYFSKENIPLGSLVSVPLRKKTSYGIALSSVPVSEIKTELKNLPYHIRKIDRLEHHTFLSTDFVHILHNLARYYVSSVGAILYHIIPQSIIAHPPAEQIVGSKEKKSFYETLLLQSSTEERFATYKSIIREEFAKGHSVFFCLPTTEDIETARETLEKGIEKYTYILHSALGDKEIGIRWKKAVAEEHPILLISTGYFFSLPRKDLGTIIVEKESSRGYKGHMRPFLDIRTVAEHIAKGISARLIFGDTLLRVETIWKIKNGTYQELSPLKFRSLSTARDTLVVLKEKIVYTDKGEKEYQIISPELARVIIEAKEKNQRMFLFCGRKGLYPTTVCADCSTTVICKNCQAPVVLYTNKSSKGNLFVCHRCGERRDAGEMCRTCGGWRLVPLGIGIEKVHDIVSSIRPGEHIPIFDKEHIKTHKEAVKVRDAFYKEPTGIMLGTEMALTYIKEKIDNVAVVSMDSFFAIPDFRIHEKIFSIIIQLREIAEQECIVQTRHHSTTIFEKALKGNLLDFYRDEIEERKTYNYPPFSMYIKLSLEGEKKMVKTEMERIVSTLHPYEALTFDSFNQTNHKKYTTHALIELPSQGWVDDTLLRILETLPPSCSIRIDPDTLL